MPTAIGIALLAASTWLFGAGHTALAAVLLATSLLSILLHDMPTDNAGHRAGGHGFGGPQPQVSNSWIACSLTACHSLDQQHVSLISLTNLVICSTAARWSALMWLPWLEQENTLEALRNLISRDNDVATGPLQKLAYVEWDVHVRYCAHLLWHKFHLGVICPVLADFDIAQILYSALPLNRRDRCLEQRQETKEGQLVVFHDDTLKRAVPPETAEAGINAEAAAALRAGVRLLTAYRVMGTCSLML